MNDDGIPRDPVSRGESEQQPAADNSEIRKAIGFGMDLEMFLRSDVGRFLSARANAEIKAFQRELEDVDASKPEDIRRLQLEIKVRRAWADWIAGAIEEGKAAQELAIERGTV